MSAFRVGQKVVCVRKDRKWHKSEPLLFRLTHRVISPNVRAVCVIDRVSHYADGEECIGLVDWPYMYFASCFRPLAYPQQSLEHDAEQFRRIARHAPVLNGEDA